LVTKHARKLIRPGGSIVFTSSKVPRRPSVGFAIGASISSAVEAFAVAMAVELAPVRVNVVAPGIVRTPIGSGANSENSDVNDRMKTVMVASFQPFSSIEGTKLMNRRVPKSYLHQSPPSS